MPTRQDEDLHNQESDFVYNPGTPLNPSESAELDQIQAGLRDSGFNPTPHTDALQKFDPDTNLAQKSDKEISGDLLRNSSFGRTDLEKAQNSNHMNYTKGGGALNTTLMNAGVSGGAMAALKMATNTLKNNKGKAATGGIVTSLIIAAGFYGGTLGLVSVKKNAERQLGGITNTIFEKEFAKNMASERQLVKSAFSSLRVEQNIDKIDRAMARAGYVLDSDGLRVPADARRGLPARTLTNEADILDEMRYVAKRELPVNLQGVRTRTRTAKAITKKVGIARRAAIDAELRADEDAKKQVKERARQDTMKGDEPDSDQYRRVNEGVGGEQVDDAKNRGEALADELTEDGTKDVVESSEDNLARNLGKNLGEEALEETARSVGQSITGRVGGLIKGDFTEVIQMTCRISQAGRAAYITGLINKKVNLMKMYGVAVNNADAIVTGQVNTQLLNAFMQAAWTDRQGTPATEAVGMDTIMSREQRPLSDGELSFFRTDREDTSGFVRAVMGLAAINIVGVNVCGAATSLIGTIAGSAIEAAIPVVAGIFTAPAGGAGAGATVAAQQAAAEGMRRSVVKVVGNALTRAIVTAGLVELTTQFGEAWMKSYVGSVMSSTMATFSDSEGGPFTGNAIAAGGGAYYEMTGRNIGMRPLTQIAYVDLMDEVREQQRTELANQSLYQRFLSLDYRHSESLAAKALSGSPIATNSVKGIAINLATNFTGGGSLNQPKKFITTAFTSTAYAQDYGVTVDSNGYVTDPFGNYVVGNNFNDVHHAQNYENLVNEGQIQDGGDPADGSGLEEYVQTCTDIDVRREEATNEVNPVCVNEEAKKYQSYLVYRGFAEALDAAYNPDIAEGSSASSPNGQLPTGTVSEADTVVTNGCGGIRVHGSIVSNVDALCAAAAAEGLNLTGGGWRSSEGQIQARIRNCGDGHYNIYLKPSNACSPPTARPGSSQHERGLAIDFENCSNRTTACYQWLSRNAGRFGLKNLPSEAWHWSTNGR